MSVNYVKFQRGSQSAYDTLKTQGRLDSNTLYFIRPNDGAQFGALYMGENIISSGDIVVESSSLADLSDVILAGAGVNYFLVRDEEGKWIATGPETVANLILNYANIPAGDNLSIEIIDNNIQLYDFGSKYYKYIPTVKNENDEVITESFYQEVEGFKEGLELHVISNNNGKYEIAWYEPSTENNDKIENIQNKVDELNQEIDAISEKVGNAADDSNTATGLYKVIEDAISAEKARAEEAEEINANAIIAEAERAEAVEKELQDAIDILNGNVEVEGSVAKKIADAIANVDHLKREIFANLDAAEAAMESYGDSAGEYIYMVGRVGSEDGNHYDEYMAFKLSEESSVWLLEKVGDWGVDLSAYAKTEDVNNALNLKANTADVESALSLKSSVTDVTNWLNNKVDKIDGHRLITAEEANKLEALSIDEDGSVGISGTVNASRVQELYNAVVNIVTGEGTSEYDGEQKTLLNIEAGAQVNVINSVNTEELTIDENKQLSIKSIVASKVTDLTSLLNAKADKVDVEALEERIGIVEGMLTWVEMTG